MRHNNGHEVVLQTFVDGPGTPVGWKRPGCACAFLWRRGTPVLYACPKHDDHEPTDDEWRCPNCGKPETP